MFFFLINQTPRTTPISTSALETWAPVSMLTQWHHEILVMARSEGQYSRNIGFDDCVRLNGL